MPAPRNRAALMTSTALLLGCALVLPVQAGQGTRRPHSAARASDPSSFDPGENARAALSRLVAEPGVVLKAYAPVSGDEVLPTPDHLPTASAGLGLVGEPPQLRPATVPSAADTGTPTGSVSGAAASGARPDPTFYESLSADAPILDATTLQNAIAAWVGAEPAPGMKLPAAEAKRRIARLAVQDFYAERGFAPLWVDYGRFDVQGRALLSRIDHAAEEGLDLRAVSVVVPNGGGPEALAASELSLTEAAVEYGRQASGGRIDPSRIGELVAAKPDVAAPGKVLSALRDAVDAGDALRAFNPPHKGYLLLRAKLAELRRRSEVAERGSIPYGPALKPGMRDARLPLIRARFGLDIPSGARAETDLVYDTQVAGAVAGYQRTHGLPASGVLTARTIASLSGGNPQRLEAEILANMERWRWLPRDLGERYIAVNIPDYSLDVYQGGQVVHHARVVVGKPDHQTPVFSDTMKFIIVNPYWNVPLSIVKKEMMPKLAADPDYFANHGYETVERNGETYVRQPPGDSNALGRIKFMFPNKFSVYLHDTNARALFGRDQRALSHGCVRVDQPFALAEVVLGRDHGWSEARVKKLVGGGERTINLPRPLPVHINYFTAFVDDGGELHLRDDIYGYSARVRAALGLAG